MNLKNVGLICLERDETSARKLIDEFWKSVDEVFSFDKTLLLLSIVSDMEDMMNILKEENRMEKGANDYVYMDGRLEENKTISRKHDRTLREIEVFYENYTICCDMFKEKTKRED